MSDNQEISNVRIKLCGCTQTCNHLKLVFKYADNEHGDDNVYRFENAHLAELIRDRGELVTGDML